MNHVAARSPSSRSRVIGAVYLLYFLAAIGSALLARGLSVPDDAAATASAILTHESTDRASVAVDLVANALYIAVIGLLCTLLAPVSRRLSLIAAFYGLVGCAVQVFGDTFRFAALVVLQPAEWLRPFTAEQLRAAALTCLKLHALSFNGSLVLFALFNLVIGHLIVRSALLPRILGLLMMLAGLGWLSFLWPPLAAALSAYVLPLGALAEFLLMLWLLVRGVRDMESPATGGGPALANR